jgi:hypothetical protein
MTAHLLRGPKMPGLYRIVNLSCYNSDVDCEPLHIDVYHRVPLDFVKRQWTHLDYNVFESQLEFIRTLSHASGLGKHVRELHWTALDLFDYEDEIWEDAKLARGIDDVKKQCERDGFPVTPHRNYGICSDLAVATLLNILDCLLRTFQTFVNVSEVDICWLQ